MVKTITLYTVQYSFSYSNMDSGRAPLVCFYEDEVADDDDDDDDDDDGDDDDDNDDDDSHLHAHLWKVDLHCKLFPAVNIQVISVAFMVSCK